MPRAKKSPARQRLVMLLNEYPDWHLCAKCGCKYANHKGGADTNGPLGRCPAIVTWGQPRKFPTFEGGKTPEQWDREAAAYWQERSTTFEPLR